MPKFVSDEEFRTNMSLQDIRYYTYAEVAKILRCSERTLCNRVKNGDILPLRNGRLVLFTKECLDEFLQKGKAPVKHVDCDH